MIDSRYPHLVRIHEITGLADAARKSLANLCQTVRIRTDFFAAFNTATGCLYFYLPGDISYGAAVDLSLARIRREDGTWMACDGAWCEQVCRDLLRGREKKERKDQILAQMQKSLDDYERRRSESDLESLRTTVADKTRYYKNREGMGSKFSPSVVIDGLKGAGR